MMAQEQADDELRDDARRGAPPVRRTSPGEPFRRALLPEHLLARLWRAREGRSLRTVDGRRVKVLYAGRPAPGHGP